jgi:hypothetical protein
MDVICLDLTVINIIVKDQQAVRSKLFDFWYFVEEEEEEEYDRRNKA